MDGSAPFQPWTSSAGEGEAERGQESPQPGPAPPHPEEAVPAVPQGPMDADRIERMHLLVENTLSAESRQHVSGLLGQISNLNSAERLLLYLKLPCGAPPADPLKQPLNPLGSRSEIHQTVMWIQTHLEVDPEISLPKQDVYDEYLDYCTRTKMKPLSTADFGKVMKQVYPCVKPRRLGTRGNSRYCYAGMRKRVKLDSPRLPDLGEKQEMVKIPVLQNDLLIAASQLIREWAEKLLGIRFNNLCELAQHLVDKNSVDAGSNAALLLADILAENNEPAGTDRDSPRQRGVIKQLKRKMQPQPHQSPSKPGTSGKRGRSADGMSPSTSASSSSTSIQPPEPPPPPLPHIPIPLLPLPHAHPFIKSELSPIPHSQPPTYLPSPYSQYSNLPINLSSSGSQQSHPPPPTTVTPRLHPLPGKKMILEAYNSENQLNSPRDYSPVRVPPAATPPHQEYLPKKMRAIESSSRLLPPINVNSPDTPYSSQTLYPPSIPSDCLNLSSMAPPEVNLNSQPQQQQQHPHSAHLHQHSHPLNYYSMDVPRMDGEGCSNPQQQKMMTSKHKGKKGSNTNLSSTDKSTNSNNANINNNTVNCKSEGSPRPAQRGRPRKKSLSKAKYTRRRPILNKFNIQAPVQQTAMTDNSVGLMEGPSQLPSTSTSANNTGCASCCCLSDTVICGEKHSEILNRERVSSICNMDKHSLDDYLNEGNSQEHEEELMKYLPPETSSSLLDDSLVQPKPQDPGNEPLLAGQMQESSLRTDFLGVRIEDTEDRNGSNNDAKISQIREFFHKSLGRNSSCGTYDSNDKQIPEPSGDGFVPISSPTASPFVSPRSTPRGRRPPLSLKPPTHFPMSAPPSPNISKYKPCYMDQGASSVLRSCLQEAGPLPSPRPPLSAEPLSREVSQFFPDSGYTNRSQSVPLHGNIMLPDFSRPPDLQMPQPYSSYTTPCNSVPPTPTPADFCDFVNLDPMAKGELDPGMIYDALYPEEGGETSETVLGDLELPNSPLEELTLPNSEREVLRRSMSADTSGPGAFSSLGGSRSVPSTPAERSYSNRDFLINGNSVDKYPGDLLADMSSINSPLYYDNL